jgi:hypothetical protein
MKHTVLTVRAALMTVSCKFSCAEWTEACDAIQPSCMEVNICVTTYVKFLGSVEYPVFGAEASIPHGWTGQTIIETSQASVVTI